jgi:hypothetical protein
VEGIQQPPGWPRQVQRHLNEALDFKHWLRRMGQGQCELVHTAVAFHIGNVGHGLLCPCRGTRPIDGRGKQHGR